MICRRSPPEQLRGPTERGRARGRAGLTGAARVFPVPVVRGGSGRRRPQASDGSSLAGGTRRPAAGGAGSGGQGRRPAAQDKRQSLHLVSGRSAPRPGGRAGAPGCCEPGPGPGPGPGSHVAAEHTRPGSEREAAAADFGASSGDSTCAPGMVLFTGRCESLGAPPSAPS